MSSELAHCPHARERSTFTALRGPDFAEWHQGCPWCAVWVVMLQGHGLGSVLQQARSRLGDALLPRHARQPHITLAYRGLCRGGDEHAAREYDRLALRADVAMLQSLRLRPLPFKWRGPAALPPCPIWA